MLRFADLLNLNSNTQTKRLMSVVIFSIEAIANPAGMVGLSFHHQPRTAMERRPYRVLQLPSS